MSHPLLVLRVRRAFFTFGPNARSSKRWVGSRGGLFMVTQPISLEGVLALGFLGNKTHKVNVFSLFFGGLK